MFRAGSNRFTACAGRLLVRLVMGILILLVLFLVAVVLLMDWFTKWILGDKYRG